MQNSDNRNSGNNNSRNRYNKNKKPYRSKPYYKSKNRSNQKPHSPEDSLFRKYEFLQEQYLNARKKYYELFFRADKLQKIKIENHYKNTLKTFNDFEKSLTDDQRVIIDKRIRVYNEDLDYSISHEVTASKLSQESENSNDPHQLSTQKGVSLKQDVEESIGTMEDFFILKPELKP